MSVCVCVMKLVCVFQEIERLKNEKPTWERQTRWAGLRSVFGGQPSLMWISPFAGLKLQTFLPRRTWKGGAEFSVWHAISQTVLSGVNDNKPPSESSSVYLHFTRRRFQSRRNQVQTLLQCHETRCLVSSLTLDLLPCFRKGSIVLTGSHTDRTQSDWVDAAAAVGCM